MFGLAPEDKHLQAPLWSLSNICAQCVHTCVSNECPAMGAFVKCSLVALCNLNLMVQSNLAFCICVCDFCAHACVYC